jgi:ABC-type antimicrobial peptide transport system permease subunit
MVEKRTKEIGVRKVLGASLPNLIRYLSREYVILVTTANLAAWPAAYFFLRGWLRDYPYRIEPGIGVFLFSGALALGIALLTVCFQVFRAARTDPVKSLRCE